jgi:hypothetical protein
MLQILVVATMLLAGLFVLVKGRLEVSKNRVLPAQAGRTLGAVFLALSALPILLPVEIGVIAMLAAFFVACGFAFWKSEPVAAGRSGAPESARTGPSRGKQLVGAKCPECTKRIMTETEARTCKTCGAAVHRECHRAHREHAHGAAPKPEPVAAEQG